MASKSYQQFTEDLEASRDAVLAVAKHIQSSGRDVVLPVHAVTPCENERFNYQDQCDLKVAMPHQIKQSSRSFQSVEEFGFPMVTVDERYKIEKQEGAPPYAYWIVNKDRTGAIVILWSTKDQWDTYTSNDATQGGRACDFMRCPARYCQFIPFDCQELSLSSRP